MSPSLDKCRLCLAVGDKDLISLKTERTGEILKKLNACVNFQVTINNQLSHSICKDCYLKVLDISSFQSKCFENESTQRSNAGLDAPVLTKNVVNLSQPKRQTLTDSGLKLLKQNICSLNDRIAVLNQEKDLLDSKVTSLQKENDLLKSAVIQHSKTLPQLTKTMSSLLSRMEQQFLFSNSRILGEEQLEEESEGGQEQMDVGYHHVATPHWPEAQSQVEELVCVPMMENETEVETYSHIEPASPTSPNRTSPALMGEEETPTAESEVNALLVQLCEQQERSYSRRTRTSPRTRGQKSEHYEVVVPRRPFINT